MVRGPTRSLPFVLLFPLAAACNGDDGGGDGGTGGSSGGATTTGGTTVVGTVGSSGPGTTSTGSTTGTAGSGTTAGSTTTAGTTGGGGPVDAFRFTELYVRDPHFYADIQNPFPIGCTDVTDLDMFGQKGVNPSFNEAMNTDMDDEMGSGMPDGNLDLSFVTLFAPLDQQNDGNVDFQRAACKVPPDNTVCSPIPDAVVSSLAYSNLPAGMSVEADPANLTPMYNPKPGAVDGPAFVATGAALQLDMGSFQLPLTDVMVAGSYDGDPADNFTAGLLIGFLSEADAAASELPQEIKDATGAQTVADLLPGSATNCAGHSDMDDNGGTKGWWMHVDFKATRVPWVP